MKIDENLTEREDLELQQCVELLRSLSIKVVVFDMDLTAVAEHSRGRLKRENLDEYVEKVKPDFVRVVEGLFPDFSLAIATHSDEAEFGGRIRPETHILGKELAMALVHRCFSPEIASSFFVVAYNPRHRPEGHKDENRLKRFHMREIQRHFQIVEPKSILFFDDTAKIVDDCTKYCGVRAVKVDPRKGFRLNDLVESLSAASRP